MSSNTDKVVTELRDQQGNFKKVLSSIPVSEIVEDNPQPPQPIAVINPANPSGIAGSIIIVSGVESLNETSYKWTVNGSITIIGADNLGQVSIKLPDQIPTNNQELVLLVGNSAGDTDQRTTSVTVLEKPSTIERKLEPISIVAENRDADKPESGMNDDDPNTRCSFDGVGSKMTFKFDTAKVKKINKIVYNCWHLDREYYWSVGGKDFTCPSGRSENTDVTEDVSDLNLNPAEVVVTGKGNSSSSYNSFRKYWFIGDVDDQEPQCPTGQEWSPQYNKCIPVCQPGSHYDPTTDSCVIDPQPGEMVRFIHISDDDVTNGKKAVYSQILTIPKNTVRKYIHSGDLGYNGKHKTWIDQSKGYFTDQEIADKWIVSRGNHDTGSSESKSTQLALEQYFKRYHRLHFGQGLPDSEYLNKIMNNSWYEKQIVGNVGIINMDTEDLEIEFKRDQYNFVADTIEEFKQLKAQGVIDWIIVVAHKPFFTLKSSHSPYTAVRFLYLQLFHNVVDLILFGHNHNRQHWKPMKPNESEANGEGSVVGSLMPDGKTWDFTREHGYICVIGGDSGHEFNSINDNGNGVNNVMFYKDSGKFGFGKIDVIGKKLNYQGIDSNGNISHEFNISKEGSGGTGGQINVTFPPSIQELQTGTIDASSSDADELTITQTTSKNINLQDAGKWIKTFTPEAV